MRMIKNSLKKVEKQKYIDNIKSKGITLTDGPLRWPEKQVQPKKNIDENFTGEIKEVVKGNHEKFKKLIRLRVKEQKYWDLIEY